jgi:hypothetical protein
VGDAWQGVLLQVQQDGSYRGRGGGWGLEVEWRLMRVQGGAGEPSSIKENKFRLEKHLKISFLLNFKYQTFVSFK